MSTSVIRRGLELFSGKDGEKQKKCCGAKHRQTSVKNKHIKSAVDEYRKKLKKNQLSSNLKYFLATENKTQSKHTGKIIQQHSGRRACHQTEITATKPEEKSVFTEQEFQKFQQEYFSKI